MQLITKKLYTMNIETKTTQKSNLTLAFEQIEKLNLGITYSQSLDLSNILCNLSMEQFNRGLDTANKIHKKYNNL